ncbi:hypothetical protein [Sphingomonas turrisvirgatae]|uniref:MobA/MobL protein domain-containing protein n=1 Tax=Sphingomonas turrisvirgatae TaxID=1888892 RepID=A0A1E3M196_9SPHN|nr:hypothetical protein [Sphingomonas turrisvirgatae]ODP39105.1 hypothetical protein BFL28_12155 [Sphingomonas turrisvirgatae]
MADYTPDKRPKIDGVDFTHGMIPTNYKGVPSTAGQAIVRRLALHNSSEPNAFDHEVLLPDWAPDHLRNLARLVETYEQQMLPAQRDLLGIATVRFDNAELLHRQWELARAWARESLNGRGLAVVLIHHVPALAGRGLKPHLHALYFPRALHACFGAFVKPAAATLAGEWQDYLGRASK